MLRPHTRCSKTSLWAAPALIARLKAIIVVLVVLGADSDALPLYTAPRIRSSISSPSSSLPALPLLMRNRPQHSTVNCSHSSPVNDTRAQTALQNEYMGHTCPDSAPSLGSSVTERRYPRSRRLCRPHRPRGPFFSADDCDSLPSIG